MIISLILMTCLFDKAVYYWEKLDVGHYWGFKGEQHCKCLVWPENTDDILQHLHWFRWETIGGTSTQIWLVIGHHRIFALIP